MRKNRLALLSLISLLSMGLIAGTFAYFTNESVFANIFHTKPYAAEAYEEFHSPDDWKPGQEITKKVFAKNIGAGDVIVRMTLVSETWVSANGATLSNKMPDGVADVAIKNFLNPSDWILDSDGYYYYQGILAPGEETSAFLGSVTLNPDVVNDTVAVDKAGKKFNEPGFDAAAWDAAGNYRGWFDAEGKLHKSYASTGDGYDGATYTLTVKAEILQADLAAMEGAWGYVPGASGAGATALATSLVTVGTSAD